MKARIFCTMLIGLVAASGGLFARTSEERIKLLEEQLKLLQREIQELKIHLLKESEEETGGSATSGSGEQASATITPKAEPDEDPNQFRVYWRDGIRMDSADEQFKLRIGGRIMNDWAFVQADDSLVESLGPLGTFVRDGTQFRRARLYASGVLYDRFEYKAEFDFADRFANFSDVYVGLRGIPVLGTLKAGHFKEPFGLEALTSANHIILLERSAGGAFAPLRNTGIAFQNTVAQGRINYSAGVFRESFNAGDSVGSGGPNLTARVTGLPLYADGGRKYLHVGAAYSHQGAPLGVALFGSHPEAALLPPFVLTPLLETSSYDMVGLEAAAVAGPFSVQSEYMQASVDSVSSDDPTFSSFYVLGSFFLTGEHRPYWHGGGSFDRVRPNSSFLDDGGTGAWEILARFSRLDLNDRLVRGGEMKNFTFGVNWYLNPYSRIMWNYVHSEVVDTGNADIVQMRFKIDF